jgi:quercetin dioxygenase-like cupin family protein
LFVSDGRFVTPRRSAFGAFRPTASVSVQSAAASLYQRRARCRNLPCQLLLLLGTASIALAQNNSPTPILPDTIKWQSSPVAPGVQNAWFVGSPDKPRLYAVRVKLPAGSKIPPHTHPDERFSIVLSRTIYVGFGENFDETNVVAIPTGGMYVAPAGLPHYVWAKDGDAMYQESAIGPTATNIIKR